MPLCLAFVDYEKAFDSIKLSSLFDAIEKQGIEPSYINLLRSIYTNATATININDTPITIKLEKCICQGYTISPKLFNAGLEEIFRRLDWTKAGIKINGKYLSHLRFADDIILLCNSAKDFQERIEELNESSKMSGLKMNLKKTQVMFNNYTILYQHFSSEPFDRFTSTL